MRIFNWFGAVDVVFGIRVVTVKVDKRAGTGDVSMGAKLFLRTLFLFVALYPFMAYGDMVAMPCGKAGVIPEIAALRVNLYYRDGVERLVVEPFVKNGGEGTRLLISLPVKKVSVKALDANEAAVLPELPNPAIDMGMLLVPQGVLFLAGALFFAVALGIRAGFSDRRRVFRSFLTLALVCLFLFGPVHALRMLSFESYMRREHIEENGAFPGVAMPVYPGRYVSDGEKGASIRKAHIATAEERETLRVALSQVNGISEEAREDLMQKMFAEGEQALAVVDIGGLRESVSQVQPLVLELTTSKPLLAVAPLNWTKEDCRMDVSVIANNAAAVPGLRRRLCTRVEQSDEGVDEEYWILGAEQTEGFRSRWMWDGAILTQMTGSLSVGSSRQSLLVHYQPRCMFFARPNTRNVAAQISLCSGVLSACLMSVAGSLLLLIVPFGRVSARKYVIGFSMASCLAGGVLGMAVWMFIEKV